MRWQINLQNSLLVFNMSYSVLLERTSKRIQEKEGKTYGSEKNDFVRNNEYR